MYSKKCSISVLNIIGIPFPVAETETYAHSPDNSKSETGCMRLICIFSFDLLKISVRIQNLHQLWIVCFPYCVVIPEFYKMSKVKGNTCLDPAIDKINISTGKRERGVSVKAELESEFSTSEIEACISDKSCKIFFFWTSRHQLFKTQGGSSLDSSKKGKENTNICLIRIGIFH